MLAHCLEILPEFVEILSSFGFRLSESSEYIMACFSRLHFSEKTQEVDRYGKFRRAIPVLGIFDANVDLSQRLHTIFIMQQSMEGMTLRIRGQSDSSRCIKGTFLLNQSLRGFFYNSLCRSRMSCGRSFLTLENRHQHLAAP